MDHAAVPSRDRLRTSSEVSVWGLPGGDAVCGRPLRGELWSARVMPGELGERGLLAGGLCLPMNLIIGTRCCSSRRVAFMITESEVTRRKGISEVEAYIGATERSSGALTGPRFANLAAVDGKSESEGGEMEEGM